MLVSHTGKMRVWCINGLLLLGSIVFVVLLLELLVRIFVSAPPNFHMRDPYIGKKHIPSAEMHFTGPDWESTVRTNTLGWNSAEFSAEKPKGVRRIVHIGDSLVESMQVNTDKTFAARIENMLPETESINLGIAGRGTYPELLTYRHYARGYDPDIIFLWFGPGNDFRDNYLVRNIAFSEGIVQSERIGWLKTLLIQHMRLPRFLYDRLYTHHVFTSLLIKMGLLSMEPEEFVEEIPLSYRANALDTPVRAEALVSTEKLLAAFKEEVDVGKLVLGIIPSYLATGPNAEKELRELYPIGDQKVDRNFASRELARIAKELELPFLDLTLAFRAAYAEGKVPHLPLDGHLATDGHVLVADEIVRWLTTH